MIKLTAKQIAIAADFAFIRQWDIKPNKVLTGKCYLHGTVNQIIRIYPNGEIKSYG